MSGRYSTKAFSAVRFTVAETTPGSRFMALSTRATQAAQVMPLTPTLISWAMASPVLEGLHQLFYDLFHVSPLVGGGHVVLEVGP